MSVYSMSQFQERTGVSRETLRFYETRGLIRPQRREGSNDRVYSDMDGLEVLRIKTMQAFQLSLDNIRDTSASLSLAEQEAHLSGLELQLEEQLAHIQNELACIRKKHSFVREAMTAGDSVSELNTYGIYKLMLLGDEVKVSPKMKEIAAQWLNCMPMCEIGWHIDRKALEESGEKPVPTQIGLMMLPRYADDYHVSIESPAFLFPDGYSIRMMIAAADPFHITRAQLEPLYAHAKRKGYRIVSDISGRYSGYSCENGMPRYYFSARVLVV